MSSWPSSSVTRWPCPKPPQRRGVSSVSVLLTAFYRYVYYNIQNTLNHKTAIDNPHTERRRLPKGLRPTDGVCAPLNSAFLPIPSSTLTNDTTTTQDMRESRRHTSWPYSHWSSSQALGRTLGWTRWTRRWCCPCCPCFPRWPSCSSCPGCSGWDTCNARGACGTCGRGWGWDADGFGD